MDWLHRLEPEAQAARKGVRKYQKAVLIAIEKKKKKKKKKKRRRKNVPSLIKGHGPWSGAEHDEVRGF